MGFFVVFDLAPVFCFLFLFFWRLLSLLYASETSSRLGCKTRQEFFEKRKRVPPTKNMSTEYSLCVLSLLLLLLPHAQ